MLGKLDDGEIEDLLRDEVVGRLGCHADGRTYVVPITYAYVEKSIVGHAVEGLKLRLMRTNPEVCFEVDRVEDLSHWRSAIVWGTFEELSGPDADRATAQLFSRLLPLGANPKASQTPKTLTHQYRAQAENIPAIAFRVRIRDWSGRFER
jgi:uncharacterized protein